MKRNLTTTFAAMLLVVLFAGSVLTSRKVETLRGKEATLEEILYLPSGKMLKRMSLGYSNLLADIYWTRAVQYFGNKHEQHSTRYDLLAPLLEITTDLDPHLIPAYQTGSIFLSFPEGARQPDKAVALLEKGIRENPEYWRLYFTLGFIHYMDRRDYKAAEDAFREGSEVPGALGWMKVMTARMAEHSGDIGTAMALWKGIYDANTAKEVRANAADHLVSLQADADIEELERRVQYFREKTRALPSRWSDLVRAGLLRGIPQDPTGAPYELMADGTVQVKDRSKFPFLGEFLQGQVSENK
jgi:tetratricopeptide (TPR) repeat protein